MVARGREKPQMSITSRTLAAGLVATAVALGSAPAATADPVYPVAGADNAQATIDALEAQGYDVQINWVFGLAKMSLQKCRVSGIHNPNSAPPTDGAFASVYVDVSCPSGDHDVGGIFGIGF